MSRYAETARLIRQNGTRNAPAVALLLLGKSASAVADTEDGVVTVSEPTTLALLVAGAAAGIWAYVRSRRRK